MSIKKYSFCDAMIIVFVVITILHCSLDLIFLGLNPHVVHSRPNSVELSQSQILIILFVLLEVTVLIMWLVKGGTDSPIWKWLPPFCFFNWLEKWQKIVFVLALIIIGIISLMKTFLQLLG